MRRDRALSDTARSRLEAALGAIGDEAGAPRPFVDLDTSEVHARAATPRHARPLAVAAAVVAVVAVGAVAGVSVWRSQIPGDSHITSGPSSSTATVPARDATSLPDDVAAAWFVVDLPDAEAGPINASSTEIHPGASTTVWIAADAPGYDEVLLLHRFSQPPDFTTLSGDEEIPIGNLDGLVLVADPSDPVSATGAGLRGDEVRWTLDSGEVFEFTSYGIDPALLIKYVLMYADVVESGCPCEIPGLDLVGTSPGDPTVEQQTIRLGEADMTLSRSATPIAQPMLADAGGWISADSTEVAGADAIVVDVSLVIWRTSDWWFSLSGIPESRLEAVIDALQPIGR